MLIKTKTLSGYKLAARDGEIGTVKEFYFDDQTWTVRYLVADTGGWLSERQVLISPFALDPADKDEEAIPVDLTRTQIENSPSLETHKPVSRRYEMQYYPYYGWPAYWDGMDTWGPSAYPRRGHGGWSENTRGSEGEDPHLRSTKDVAGHTIQALDGDIGHVEDFVVDDETWTIRYLIVDTNNWWPGKKVLVSTQWIERISWAESRVFINLTQASIKQAPEFTEESLITRAYEADLHRYYKRDAYWEGHRVSKDAR